MAGTRFTPAEIESAIQLYEAGLMHREIGAKIGRPAESVRLVLKRCGIQSRSYRDYYAAKVNGTYFQQIDHERKAYWLGFLAADGCIGESAGDWRGFHFYLKRGDRSALETFAAHIGYSGVVRDTQRQGKTKIHLKSGIDFNNRVFCQHLLDKGWMEFKKRDDPTIMLASVPTKLQRHFIRGFFDGDGCISHRKLCQKSHYFTFSGQQRDLQAIEAIIVGALGFGQKGPKPSKSGNCYRMGWNGNRQVARFGRWLYKDATVWLDRKRERFEWLQAYLEGRGIPVT